MSQTPAKIPAQTPPAPRIAPVSASPALAPVWSARRPVAVGLVTIALLVGGFGGWSLLTDIDGAIVAPGRAAILTDHP